MTVSKLAKSPKLGVIFQFTDLEAEAGVARAWEIHDIERNRGFRVRVPAAVLEGSSPGGSQWRTEQIEAGVLAALERALVEGPEKLPGQVYDVEVTTQDLQAALAEGS